MRTFLGDFLSALRGNRRAAIGSLILVGYLLMALIGPELIPMDSTMRYAERFRPPSLAHPLGTDYAGRDVLAQIVHGSRDVLAIAILTALFTTSMAVGIGALAGYSGGMVDGFLMLLTNIQLTVPAVPVYLLIGSVFQIRDPVGFAVLISLWMWGPLARAVRSQILSLKEREFIEAARVLGLGTTHILARELFPNLTPFVVIHFIRMMRDAITASVGLIFLGLAPFSPTNWGTMLNLAVFQTGAIYIPNALHYVIAPMAAIVLFQLGAIFFAHGLDEILNPRLRAPA
ncbi:ABC transporter permease [Thermoflexus sp.]|uniref:ABC transporter permease n=1 Tax=Thermoflexus sp. TaxID=1969742 RepID=UPI00175E34D1|nr:ABC transporter permease [Thermoflexus sp.]